MRTSSWIYVEIYRVESFMRGSCMGLPKRFGTDGMNGCVSKSTEGWVIGEFAGLFVKEHYE